MTNLFLTILNMSITGAFVIAAICLARLPLKKAPKLISYCLWTVAGFRLAFPFSIESIFSLIPFKTAPIPLDIPLQAAPYADSSIPVISYTTISILPSEIPATAATGINSIQIWTTTGAYVWLIVAAVMIVFGIFSYIRLKYKMKNANLLEGNIYSTNALQAPFVLGFLKSKIYIPYDIDQTEYEYIVLHEQTHIKRFDHISKAVAYLILCVHWFNPLAWAAFLLMSIDMEMSCDEHVLKLIGLEKKKEYSLSLLSHASGRRIFNGSPLAFSEGGLKERVKRVLSFRKPSRIVIISAVLLAAVFSIGFALNKITDDLIADVDIEDEITAIETLEAVERTEVSFTDGQVHIQSYTQMSDINNRDSNKWSVNSSDNNVFLKGNDTEVDIDEILFKYTSAMNRHVNNNIPDVDGVTYYSKITITGVDLENGSETGYATIYVELDSLLDDIRETAQFNATLNRNIDTVNYMMPVMVFSDTIELSEISGNGVDHYLCSVSIVVPRGYMLRFDSNS